MCFSNSMIIIALFICVLQGDRGYVGEKGETVSAADLFLNSNASIQSSIYSNCTVMHKQSIMGIIEYCFYCKKTNFQ